MSLFKRKENTQSREGTVERKSTETEITARLNVDGAGTTKIKTNIGILDHMLELFAFHGFFDLELTVEKADLEIDIHHTNEDIGIVLGKVFNKALAEKTGIRRFGSACAPMEATLGHSVVDISGRGYLYFKVNGAEPTKTEDGYSLTDLKHFLESFANHLGANINIAVENPSEDSGDTHTVLETVFKSLGLALDEATRVDPRREGIPSTKGIID